MSTTLRRAGAAVLAAALVASPLFGADAATPAKAGKRFGTVLKLDDATLQACKQLTQDGTRFRVYLRVDNTDFTDYNKRLRGTATVIKDDGDPRARDYDSGSVGPGKVSTPEYVVVVKGSGDRLEVTLSGQNSGTGDMIGIGGVSRTC